MNTLNTDATTHPFLIYDQRKLHGYIYYPGDTLYHFTDRQNLRKYIPKNHIATDIISSECSKSSGENNLPPFITKDLRSIMDFSQDTLPIKDNKILTPSICAIRDRNETDHFTYQLDVSADRVFARSFSDRISIYMKLLIPNEAHRNLLRSFLKSSLITYVPESFIVIKGETEAYEQLANLLLLLDPLIKKGRKTLYCELNVNKIALDEVHQARIVICDVGERTIRVAQPPIRSKVKGLNPHSGVETFYQRPIQYHGIVFQQNIGQSSPRGIQERTIELITTLTDKTFTSEDVLAWILASPL
ncbi:Hypothetical protein HVR_LOCUS621 [uncultured virus]|nr:Hypothetical protein HVR_LOCUS621 [uncultured virus]